VADASTALWAKCDTCGHCWPAAYYPLELDALARVLKNCACPRGCGSRPVLAKQDDGVLKEPSVQVGNGPASLPGTDAGRGLQDKEI
jgi:hypothetical protein